MINIKYANELLTIKQTAEVLKVSPRQVYVWISQKKLKPIKISHRIVRIPAKQITMLCADWIQDESMDLTLHKSETEEYKLFLAHAMSALIIAYESYLLNGQGEHTKKVAEIVANEAIEFADALYYKF